MLRFIVCAWLILAGSAFAQNAGEDKLFSGPQPGEKLPGFKVTGVYDELSGKEIDFVSEAGAKPLLLLFVHDPLTRPSAAVTRGLAEYAFRHKNQLAAGIIWLKEDRSAAEHYLKRTRKSLRLKAPVGVSVDGVEGPGAYGLNRHASLTILVAKEGLVTANFALIQPSTTDGPKIIAEISKLIGEKPLTQEQFDRLAYGRGRYQNANMPDKSRAAVIPRELLAAVIDRKATPEQVEQAANKVEKFVQNSDDLKDALGRIAARIVQSGKLKQYGTAPAQEKIQHWAKTYGPREKTAE